MPWSEIATQPGVHRVPRAARRSLSTPDGNQADPRQPFRAHIEKKTWLAAQPAGRFEFTFTPTHGSWLNLVEGFFSKFARSLLRHIRVTSKNELKQRILAGIDGVNRYPVVHTWSHKLAEAA
jgi:DDE superfamily endonuclease